MSLRRKTSHSKTYHYKPVLDFWMVGCAGDAHWHFPRLKFTSDLSAQPWLPFAIVEAAKDARGKTLPGFLRRCFDLGPVDFCV